MGKLALRIGLSGIMVSAGTAAAQLVFGYPTYTYDLRRFDAQQMAFVAPKPMFLEVYGMAADEQGLWIACGPTLYRWLYSQPTATLVGTFSGPATMIVGGLAWDSARQVLYATGGPTFFQQDMLVTVNTTTCATTLVRTIPTTELAGLDYDAERDRLLFTNDRTAGLNGFGLYALPWPFATSTPVQLAPYADSWQYDVDGVAVGGGYAWLVCDRAQWLYRFNLTTNQYETPILMSFNVHHNLSVGATWAPLMMDQVEHDLSVTLSVPAACTVGEGGSLTLQATALHVGGTQPTPNAKIAFTLPVGVDPDQVRSVPLGAWDGQGHWVVNLGTFAPQASQTVTLTVDAVPAGTFGASAAVSSSQADARGDNNTASASTRVREAGGPAADGVGLGVGILASTIDGDNSARLEAVVGDVGDPRHHGLGAGLANATIATLGVDGRGARGIAHSPDGAWVLVHAVLDTGQGVLLRLRSDQSEPGRIVARTGAGPLLTLVSGPYVPTRLDSCAINNAGVVALAAQANNKAVLVRIDEDGNATTVLEQGVTSLGAFGAGVTPGSLIQSPVIGEFGQVGCVTTLSGVAAGVDRAIVADDGARLVAQKGVTLPLGQFDASGNGTTFFVRTLDEGVPGLRVAMDSSLNLWLAPGAIAASQTSPSTSGVDRVLVQGNAWGVASVVAQENIATSSDSAAGALADLEPLTLCEVDGQGTWWAGVARRDGTGALYQNGTPIASSGAAAWPDGPHWASAKQPGDSGQGANQTAIVAFATSATPIDNGARVIVGHVESATVRRDGVAVLDGFGPILSENEALIGEGALTRYVGELFPGGVSVSTRDAVVLVGLRDRDSAEGCGTDALVGAALVRVPISSACPSCPADYDGNGGVDGGDLGAFFQDFEQGPTCADVDQNGGVDGGDLAAFFVTFEAGGC